MSADRADPMFSSTGSGIAALHRPIVRRVKPARAASGPSLRTRHGGDARGGVAGGTHLPRALALALAARERAVPPSRYTGDRASPRHPPEPRGSRDTAFLRAACPCQCRVCEARDAAAPSRMAFTRGDLVWARVHGHPRWPGQVFDPERASREAQRVRQPGKLCVAFFGDRSFGWFTEAELQPFAAHYEALRRGGKTQARACRRLRGSTTDLLTPSRRARRSFTP